MWIIVTKLIDLVLLLQDKHLILLPHHDSHPFPPSLKGSVFGVLMLFVILGNFLVYLISRCSKMEKLVLKRVPNVFDLVFLLHYRQLIFLAQHDSQPFPPSI